MLSLRKGRVRAVQPGAPPERGLGEQPSLAAAGLAGLSLQGGRVLFGHGLNPRSKTSAT